MEGNPKENDLKRNNLNKNGLRRKIRWVHKNGLWAIRKNKVVRFAIASLVLVLLLEIFVFNFNAFHLWFRDYTKTDLLLKNGILTNFVHNQDGTLKNSNIDNITESSIEFTDINIPVGTIFIDVEFSDNVVNTNVKIDFSDETSNKYIQDKANMMIINGVAASQNIPCHFSGSVKKLNLKFNLRSDQNIIIKGITLNKPIGFNFSLVRFLSLYITLLGIYSLIYSKRLRKPYSEKKDVSVDWVMYLTATFVMLAIFTTMAYNSTNKNSILQDFMLKSGNQLTQELVDSFESGQVKLLTVPSAELLALKNPYDWSERASNSVYYLWDHCLYKGNYYSYYGIAPVVLLFLPYHLLTQYYFPTTWAVLLFGIIGIIFLSKLYMVIIHKWFKELQINLILMGLIMLQISSGIWFSLARPLFYEIAIASGFASITIGVYFLLSSNVLGAGKISFIKITLATTFLSLAVMCRPTMAMYCLVAVVFFCFGLRKITKSIEIDGRINMKFTLIKYVFCAFSPFIIFGSIQMMYNWIRFDSVINFGLKYSLSVTDFTNIEYHIQYTSIGLFAYLFAAPQVLPTFPFVFSNFQMLNLNGSYYVDNKWTNGVAIGIFFRALPMFFYLFARKAYRIIDGNGKIAFLFIGLASILAPLIIIFSTWSSGYAIRYYADFSWEMLLGALIIVFVLFVKSKSAEVKSIITGFFAFFMLTCLIINIAQIISFINPNQISLKLQISIFELSRIFEFWR